jgi:hypothetical protein
MIKFIMNLIDFLLQKEQLIILGLWLSIGTIISSVEFYKVVSLKNYGNIWIDEISKIKILKNSYESY